MGNFKKLGGLMLALFIGAFIVQASPSFQSASFLNADAVQLAPTTNAAYGVSLVSLKPGASTYTTNSGVIKDLPLWANADGTFPTNATISVDLVGTNASDANVLTITLTGIPSGVGGNPGTVGALKSTFTATNNGTSQYVTSAPLPPALAGCGAVRVAVTNNGATYTTIVKKLRLNGFQ